MTKTAYIERRFGPAALRVIAQAERIATDYARQGFDLTLRQLYYQFVARDLIPNNDREYKRLGATVADARLAGLLDWEHIVDRTRNLRALAHQDDPASAIQEMAEDYLEDKWANQPEYVECWIEKDALVGVLQQACARRDTDVPFFSCRGYTSVSEIWAAGQRIGEKIAKGKRVTIIHLGDHDPSGIDMSRDIEDRLRMFVAQDVFDARYDRETLVEIGRENGVTADVLAKSLWRTETDAWLTVERIALNFDQVQQYQPPPNPAKITDSRAAGYIERFGRQSWELDALDPATLVGLIESTIREHRDESAWAEAVEAEATRQQLLQGVSDRWGDVADFLEDTA